MGSRAEKTLVFIATYNEIESLPALVDEIHRHVPAADILVIDDHSPDGTGQWCDRRAAEDPRVRCLHRPSKLGLGTATLAGLRYGIEQGYSQVVNMDADFSHHPRYLPALLAGMDPPDGPAVDVMIGSRYVPGGGIEGWPWMRHVMSRGVNFLSRRLLGLSPGDCSGAYRCYRASVLARVDFDRFRSHGYSIEEEILWHLKRAGARFGETPIVFVDRRAGRSKINWKEALRALGTIFVLGLENLLPRRTGSPS
jgi:dolichol-phosphate mannosyltransferase